MTPPAIGCTADDLDTPALCLDLDALERNIAAVAKTCKENGVAWRPHCKGHKIPAIAKLELAVGAIGITCAKLGEAEVMAAAGIKDLLIANMIVGPQKVRRVVELRKLADPIVTVDHVDQVDPIAAAAKAAGVRIRLLIEVNIGLNRVGVLPADAIVLARHISTSTGVALAGIMGYEGHLLTIEDQNSKAEQIEQALAILAETKDLLAAVGIDCPIVSCGGTGSYRFAVMGKSITEIQAGGAVYMDAFYRHKCQIVELDYAMTVLTTVVSRPALNRAIVDAGRKSINIEIHTPLVYGRDDMRVLRLSAEHGQIELDASAAGLRIGDRIALVPGYGDLTTVLHDVMYGFRRGKLEVIWPIAARGKIQ